MDNKLAYRALRICSLLAVLAMLLSVTASAQVQGISNGLCQGSTNQLTGATTNGIIGTPILGASPTATQGVGTVIAYATIIMMAVLMVLAIIYMVSSAIGLESLHNIVKSELVEIAATGILIAIFFGGFLAVSQLTGGGSGLAFTGPSKGIYVNDCEMLAGSALGTIPAQIGGSVVTTLLNTTLSNVEIELMPSGFGFTDEPLAGLTMIPDTLKIANGALFIIMIALLSLVFLLGLIYTLFPILLYAGIVLRSFPWTRAAGGVMISVFIGFFIVFPLLLFATLHGFSTVEVQVTNNYTNQTSVASSNFVTANSAQSVGNLTRNFSSLKSGPNVFVSIGNFIVTMEPVCASSTPPLSCHGLINGFISAYLEPAGGTLVAVIFALIIALDFTDILADILGAPNLQASSLISKVL